MLEFLDSRLPSASVYPSYVGSWSLNFSMFHTNTYHGMGWEDSPSGGIRAFIQSCFHYVPYGIERDFLVLLWRREMPSMVFWRVIDGLTISHVESGELGSRDGLLQQPARTG